MMETQFYDESAEPYETGYSGTLRFYGIEGDINDDGDLWVWHECQAEFADGRCRGIRLVKSVTGAELHKRDEERRGRETPG